MFSKQEPAASNDILRTWKLAVVVFRKRSDTQWDIIKGLLRSRLGKAIKLIPMATDSSVSWCRDEKEKNFLMTEENLFYRGAIIASMEQWSTYSHWNYVWIEARNSWIGIEGLPLNLWNCHVLKLIGDTCGGLFLVIVEETLNQSFLLYGKIIKKRISGRIYVYSFGGSMSRRND